MTRDVFEAALDDVPAEEVDVAWRTLTSAPKLLRRNEVQSKLRAIAPNGAVYQAGTLAGSPLAVSAGLAMLEVISEAGFYEELHRKTKLLMDGLEERASEADVPFTTNQAGGMFGCFFNTNEKVRTFKEVMESNEKNFRTYFHEMLNNGVYLAPSMYEAGFVSMAHTEEEIRKTLDASSLAFEAIKNN